MADYYESVAARISKLEVDLDKEKEALKAAKWNKRGKHRKIINKIEKELKKLRKDMAKNEKRDDRNANRTDRRDSREEKVATRQEGRTDRKTAKMNAFETAYANGIDPRAGAIQAVGDAIGQTAKPLAEIFGEHGVKATDASMLASAKAKSGQNNIFIFIAVAIFVLFMPKGRKK